MGCAMQVRNLRDAIILNLLKDGTKTGTEIRGSLGIEKSITKKSLAMLRVSGLVGKKGRDGYFLTENGKETMDRLYRKMSLLK